MSSPGWRMARWLSFSCLVPVAVLFNDADGDEGTDFELRMATLAMRLATMVTGGRVSSKSSFSAGRVEDGSLGEAWRLLTRCYLESLRPKVFDYFS